MRICVRLSPGIAHEVNNPLAVIAFGIQLLLREEELPPLQWDIVERIDGEVERLRTRFRVVLPIG